MRIHFTLMILPLLSNAACSEDPPATEGNETASTGEDSIGTEGSGGVLTTTGMDSDAESGGGTTSTGAVVTSGDAGESSGDGSDGADFGTSSGTGDPQGQDVDLANYTAASPVQSIPAPGTNASGMTWNYDTDRLWIVQNGAAAFFEYAPDDLSSPIRRIDLAGANGNDTEGLAYMGGGELAVAFEGGYGVYIADVPDGDSDTTAGVKQVLTLASPPSVGNNGLEGIAYDAAAEVFYAVGEGQAAEAPRRFFRFERPSDRLSDLTWQDPGLTVTEPFDADEVLPGSGSTFDLAGIVFDPRDGNVLLVSHTARAVAQLDPTGDGTILSQLDLPDNQWEGVTLHGPAADLWVVGESNEVQRYVYEPG